MIVETAFTMKFEVGGREYKFTVTAPTPEEAKSRLKSDLESIIIELI